MASAEEQTRPCVARMEKFAVALTMKCLTMAPSLMKAWFVATAMENMNSDHAAATSALVGPFPGPGLVGKCSPCGAEGQLL